MPIPHNATDAFCSQADVEAKAQRGVYDATTCPTSQQVLDFMAMRAGEVEGVLQRASLPYTVPSRGTPFPTYGAGPTTDQEERLIVLCQQANAYGAAADAVLAQDANARATSKDLIETLMAMYRASLEALEDYATQVIESATAAGTVNRTVPLTISAAVSTPLPMGYDTKW